MLSYYNIYSNRKEHSIMEHPTNLIIRDCTSQGSELCHELADALFQHRCQERTLHKVSMAYAVRKPVSSAALTTLRRSCCW